jgi:outer membrane protein
MPFKEQTMTTTHESGVNMKSILKIGFVATAMSMAMPASALDLQDWSFKVGMNQIVPDVASGNMTAPALPGTQVDVDSDTQPIFTVSYAYNDYYSVELLLGLPYTHDINGAGAVDGAGTTGTVESLPPTIFGQYYLLPAESKFRTYLGLGVTYAYFQNETGTGALTALTNTGSPTATTFTVDSAWGVSAQIGAKYYIDDHWFVDASIVKTYLQTTAHFSTGQTVDVHLDPHAYSMGVGYRF